MFLNEFVIEIGEDDRRFFVGFVVVVFGRFFFVDEYEYVGCIKIDDVLE